MKMKNKASVHATITHKRKKKPKCNFAVVVGTFLVTSALMSSMSTVAFANTPDPISSGGDTAILMQVQDNSITSLLNATQEEVMQLKGYLDSGKISSRVMGNIYKNLAQVENYYFQGEVFNTVDVDALGSINVMYNAMFDAISASDLQNMMHKQSNSEQYHIKTKGILNTLMSQVGNTSGGQVTQSYDERLNNFIARMEAQYFGDVGQDTWYYNTVTEATKLGIINGFEIDGEYTFKPEGTLTVAEALTLASKVNAIFYGRDVPAPSQTGHWASDILQYAKDNGIVYGTSSISEFTEADLDSTIQRGTMAWMFHNAVAPNGELASSVFDTRNDASAISNSSELANSAFKDVILEMYQSGILIGDENNNLNLDSSIRRCEAAAIILRVAKPSERVTVNKQVSVATGNYYERMSALLGFDVTELTGTPNIYPGTIYVQPTTEYGQKGSLVPRDGYTQINTLYGTHTYGCNNQEEYDKVMSFVHAKIEEGLNSYEAHKGTSAWQSVGNLCTDINAFVADGTAGGDGVNIIAAYGAETAFKIYNLSDLLAYIQNMVDEANSSISVDGNIGESAYDSLFKGGADCSGTARLNMAIADTLGINSRVVGSAEACHAWSEMEIAGQWVDVMFGGEYATFDQTKNEIGGYSDLQVDTDATIDRTAKGNG